MKKIIILFVSLFGTYALAGERSDSDKFLRMYGALNSDYYLHSACEIDYGVTSCKRLQESNRPLKPMIRRSRNAVAGNILSFHTDYYRLEADGAVKACQKYAGVEADCYRIKDVQLKENGRLWSLTWKRFSGEVRGIHLYTSQSGSQNVTFCRVTSDMADGEASSFATLGSRFTTFSDQASVCRGGIKLLSRNPDVARSNSAKLEKAKTILSTFARKQEIHRYRVYPYGRRSNSFLKISRTGIYNWKFDEGLEGMISGFDEIRLNANGTANYQGRTWTLGYVDSRVMKMTWESKVSKYQMSYIVGVIGGVRFIYFESQENNRSQKTKKFRGLKLEK